MRSQNFLVVFAACLTISYGPDRSAVAQTVASDQKKTAEEPDSTTAEDAQSKDTKPKAPATPGCTNGVDDDIGTREKLTGDWGGARTDLENHGVKIDLRLTQYFQGVADGGSNTNFAYGGKFDIILDLDGQKMGLWEGLFINVHAEEQFGNGILADAGDFALPNTLTLYPLPGYRDVAVTQVLVEQFLSKNFAVALGKINVIDFWTMVYPETGGGVDGFMNTNMFASALPWLRWVNLSFLAGGALFVTDDEQLQGGVFALDLNNVTTTTGIPEVFDDGAGVLGFWRFFFDVDDKPASLLFVGGGSTREYHSFESHATGWDPGIISNVLRVTEDKDDGVWGAGFYYDQVLWEEPANDKQNVRFFTGWSVSDGDPSFGRWGGFTSLEATGLLFNREKDRAGVGGFYNGLGSDFKKTMDGVGIDLRDTWGFELYYNAEITPWFHLTGDVQVVQNENDDDDPGVILGLRGVLEF